MYTMITSRMFGAIDGDRNIPAGETIDDSANHGAATYVSYAAMMIADGECNIDDVVGIITVRGFRNDGGQSWAREIRIDPIHINDAIRSRYID